MSSLQMSKGAPSRGISMLNLNEHLKSQTQGTFRFTPPSQSLLACRQALEELKRETVEGRAIRYSQNAQTLLGGCHSSLHASFPSNHLQSQLDHTKLSGMKQMGFHTLVQPEHLGHISTSFFFPVHHKFKFDTFFNELHDRGYVIHPGLATCGECFEIGHIGNIYPSDVRNLLTAIQNVKKEMDF